MKFKLSLLLFSIALFCQEPKTKWVKDDIKCGLPRGVSCTDEEIEESKNKKRQIDEKYQKLKSPENQNKKDELKLEIEELEKNQKCRLTYIGTLDPQADNPNGSWVKYDRATCSMTSEPCPNKDNPELDDNCEFNIGSLMTIGED